MNKVDIRNFIISLFVFASNIILCSESSAQLIDNKVNIYTSFFFGTNHGDTYVNNDGFIASSLFANFNQNKGIQFSVTYKLKPWLAPGFHLSADHSTDWVLGESVLYRKSMANSLFIGPGFRFYTPRASDGFFNRFSAYIEIASGAAHVAVKLLRPINAFEYGINSRTLPIYDTNWCAWMQARIGAKFDLNSTVGFHINYSLSRNQINGILFNDKTMVMTRLEFGFHLRFFENKRYYY